MAMRNRNFKRPLCPFCLRVLSDREKKQKLCGDCYDLRRVIRRMWRRGGVGSSGR